jgi:hypothetical protein
VAGQEMGGVLNQEMLVQRVVEAVEKHRHGIRVAHSAA